MDAAATGWSGLLDRHPALRLLVLLGSRALGDAHAASDRDRGHLAGGGLDALALRADAVDALGTGAVDLVPLASASAVLRRDAAATPADAASPTRPTGQEPTAHLDAAGDPCYE